METIRIGEKKLAFIGGGNMAEALVNGILTGGVVLPEKVRVSDPEEERRNLFRDKYGAEVYSDNSEALSEAHVCVLAVKPQILDRVLEEISSTLEDNTLVISIAAGVRTERIEKTLASDQRVVRAMPNTPALIGMGIAAICAGSYAEAQDLDIAELLLGALGKVVRVEEGQMDAVTAMSGSGPAYVFLFLENMIQAGIEMGLPADTARLLATTTVEGGVRLMQETGEDAATLRERVTSKGGTTAAALNCMQDNKFDEILKAAIHAARDRSVELSTNGN